MLAVFSNVAFRNDDFESLDDYCFEYSSSEVVTDDPTKVCQVRQGQWMFGIKNKMGIDSLFPSII